MLAKKMVSESAHLVLAAGRRAMAAHFIASNSSRTTTTAWPAVCPLLYAALLTVDVAIRNGRTPIIGPSVPDVTRLSNPNQINHVMRQ